MIRQRVSLKGEWFQWMAGTGLLALAGHQSCVWPQAGHSSVQDLSALLCIERINLRMVVLLFEEPPRGQSVGVQIGSIASLPFRLVCSCL